MFRACGSILDSLFSCGSTVYGKDDKELADEQDRLVRDADAPIMIQTLNDTSVD